MYTYPQRNEKCTVCDGEFRKSWHRVDAKYCSNACRQKAYRDKIAAAAEAVRAKARDKKAKAKARRFKKLTSGSRPTKK